MKFWNLPFLALIIYTLQYSDDDGMKLVLHIPNFAYLDNFTCTEEIDSIAVDEPDLKTLISSLVEKEPEVNHISSESTPFPNQPTKFSDLHQAVLRNPLPPSVFGFAEQREIIMKESTSLVHEIGRFFAKCSFIEGEKKYERGEGF